MDIEIRTYEDSDLDGVNSLLDESFQITKNNFNISQCSEIVACDKERIVGYLLLTDVLNPVKNKIYCLIDYVCVSSEYRGAGIGGKLLEFAETMSKEKGAMYLQLTCSHIRTSAHKLYEKCGFIKRDSYIFRKELV